jgi:very-short-patch-repair endonuclease
VGDFIVDFACTEYQLAIEVDGGQHSENAADTTGTAWLQSQGWRVLRFWNNGVLSYTNGVIGTILRILKSE